MLSDEQLERALSQEGYGRDERDRVAAKAIYREAQRWGHGSVTPSLAVLCAARAIDALARLDDDA